jgi:hypothetical protein
MTIAPRTGDTSTFSCTVETVLPAGLRSLSRVAGVGRALRKHVDEETAGYAADLGRKLQNKDGGLSTYSAASRPIDAPGPDQTRAFHPVSGSP